MADDTQSAREGVERLIQQVRDAGLGEAAEVFSNAYWGWIRTTGAYRHALPYVEEHPEHYTPSGVLHVTTWTINHWSPLIPGTERIDNEAVRRADRADEAWHHAEDRRMRIAAGEDI